MAREDPVDDKALIFTEADVYMIGGYLAKKWGVNKKTIPEDTEEAIMVVLAHNNTKGKTSD